MEIITELTEEQIAIFPVDREKWLKIGLCTDRIDKEKAIEAVKTMYEYGNCPHPKEFYFAESPQAAIKLIMSLDSTETKEKILSDTVFGCHEAGWLSYYNYMKEVLKVENSDQITGLLNVAYNVGWVNPYEDLVVIQERPTAIYFDENDVLHRENGPAIEYSDGFSVYSWHGTRVLKEWIEEPWKLSAAAALNWQNIEERRCACEILGWHKILEELDARVIEQDEDPTIGTLVEVVLPDIGVERFIRVLCGTKREFAIPVPPTMQTALEANAWTYGLEPEQYTPEIRT
jgi:hypothetical protein